jgi:hypothetical protein
MGWAVPHAISSDPKHWRARADEARAMAEKITDAKAKLAMLEIAKNYEHIAERAELRQQDRK